MGHAGVGAITGVHNVCERIITREFWPYKVVWHRGAANSISMEAYLLHVRSSKCGGGARG